MVALAPLGLESSAFAGLGRTLARRGWRTIGIDLPGSAETPAPDAPLTPAVLAEPVIALARSLGAARSPRRLARRSGGARGRGHGAGGIPFGRRDRARPAVAAIAPAWADAAALIDPGIADWIPLERAWPVLRWLARLLETTPYVRDDELAQAGARLVYYSPCPATRRSMFSAGRELALDPGHGPTSLWSRLPSLTLPTAFVWAERDQMISLRFAAGAARHCPQARQLLLPCLGHWLNGVHHRCLGEAVGRLLDEMEGRASNDSSAGVRTVGHATLELRGCVVGAKGGDERIPGAAEFEEGRHVG